MVCELPLATDGNVAQSVPSGRASPSSVRASGSSSGFRLVRPDISSSKSKRTSRPPGPSQSKPPDGNVGAEPGQTAPNTASARTARSSGTVKSRRGSPGAGMSDIDVANGSAAHDGRLPPGGAAGH